MDLPASLAHYTIVAPIGEGGMGEVVRARDTRLGREVALKLLPVEFADDPERLARFEREARTLAQLQHPNIATIHGLEKDGGRIFLVMELVEGEDLAQRLARGPVPVEEAVGIAAQIATGLEEAHERGIVHRDLKPANVMLTPTGQVKILDFGLARAFLGDGGDDGDISNSPTLTAAMTGAGTILGTAAYMSPEQARGKPVDRRADIWALGVILHEMLAGRRLFAGETVSDTLAAVLRKEVDLAALPRSTPPAVRRLVARCLDRDPRRRLRDAGEARIVLEDPAALKPSPPAQPAGSPHHAAWIVAAVVLACVAAGAAWLFKPLPERPLRKLELSAGPGRQLDARESGVAVSPDGRWIAYSSGGALWIRSLAANLGEQVNGSDGVVLIFWSPDSRYVGFSVGRDLWKVPAQGGQPQRVGELPSAPGGAAGGAWLPDDRIYVTTGNSGILAAPAAGGRFEEVLPVATDREQDLHNAVPLPDGGLVFVEHRFEGVNALGVWRGGERKTILHLPGEYLKRPCWAPSGHILYCQGEGNSTLWALPFDAGRLEVTGDPFFVADVANLPTVSDDGTLVYLSGGTEAGDQELVLLDRQGRTLQAFGTRPSFWPYPALGERLDLAAAVVRETGTWDLWVFDDRGAAVRLTDDATEEDCPILTRDGRDVIYAVGHAADWRLVRRAVDGTGDVPILVAHDGPLPPHYYGTNPWISADGRLLLYAAVGVDEGQDIALLRLDADGLPAGEPEAVIATKANELGPALSPDGRFIAYMSDVTGRYEVYVAQFPSGAGRRQISVGGATWPRWRGDGRELYFVASDTLAAVDIELGERLLIGPQRALMPMPRSGQSMFTGFTEAFDVTPDGQKFLVTRWRAKEGEAAPPAHIVVVDNWISEFR